MKALCVALSGVAVVLALATAPDAVAFDQHGGAASHGVPSPPPYPGPAPDESVGAAAPSARDILDATLRQSCENEADFEHPECGASVAYSRRMSLARTASLTSVTTNGPIPDTPGNRARFGGPVSGAGKKTKAAGN